MRLDRRCCSALGLVLIAGSADAGGFNRGTADTDILYEEGNFNFRAGVTYVAPSQKFSAAPAAQFSPGLVGTGYLDNYAIPSAAIKLRFSDNLSCAGTYTDAYGASSSHPVPYGPAGKRSEAFTVAEFGATCALFFDLGKGRFSILGGGFIEKFDYDLQSTPPSLGGLPFNVHLENNAYGWRAGIGYEIPEIALRAQLMYRSGTVHDGASGDATVGLASNLPAFAYGELPQSVDFKFQTGIAPGWLAFGSIKWTDWDVNETLQLAVPLAGVESVNQYYWRDGWTINAGIGHAFNERVSGIVSIGWDRGVSTGYDLRGDRWMLAAGATIKDDIGGELRFGAAVSHLGSAEITASDAHNIGAAVDSGWALALTAGYNVKF